MATFMDVHSGFVGVTEAELQEAHEKDLAIEREEGVHFEHAWVDPVSGRAFCLSTGPDKEAVKRVHERAGHPTDEVYEVPLQV
ncbi:SCO4226 family nickel-binding protein [Actinomycetes bacterium KLBMP 9797]